MAKASELFIESVRTLLNQEGRSQRALALEAGIDPSRLAKLLNGQHEPSSSTMDKIAHALGVSPAYLLATPEERARLRPGSAEAQNRPLDQIPAQERLQAVARLLPDAEAATVLALAEGLLLEHVKQDSKKTS